MSPGFATESADPAFTPNPRKYDLGPECSVRAGVSIKSVSCQIVLLGKQERRMSNLAIRLSVLAMFSRALRAAPAPKPAFAAGGENPAPPASDTNTKSGKDKKKKTSE